MDFYKFLPAAFQRCISCHGELNSAWCFVARAAQKHSCQEAEHDFGEVLLPSVINFRTLQMVFPALQFVIHNEVMSSSYDIAQNEISF